MKGRKGRRRREEAVWVKALATQASGPKFESSVGKQNRVCVHKVQMLKVPVLKTVSPAEW